jgi:hypothetical protein
MATSNETPSTPLNSWKDIAEYLKVTERTAQRYEAGENLPVHRMPGKKGRVYAFPAELDAWKESQSSSGLPRVPGDEIPVVALPTPESSSAAITEPGWQAVLTLPLKYRSKVLAGVVLLAAIAAIGSVIDFRRGQPEQFRVEGQALVVTDAAGRECWRYQFPEVPTTGVYGPQLASRRRSQFVDLDRNGRPELLLQYLPVGYETLGSSLYCFSDNGQFRWKFHPGRQVADGRGTFSPVYWQDSFAVIDSKDNEGPRIVLTAHHATGYPNQVVALDSGGNLLGKYWHSGHLRHLVAADLDGDGIGEAILAGANVGERRATLVVLDPRSVSGASRQPTGDWHQLQGFSPGTEKAVVLFPSSCLAKHEEFTIVSHLTVTENRISAVVQQSVDDQAPFYLTFDLDWSLKVLSVVPSDTYVRRHREMEVQGLLDHQFTIQEIDKLKEQVEVRRANR